MDNKDAHEMPVAYIAGALNDMAADYIQNVRRMILWGDKVRELGFSVFVPGIDFLCGVVTGNWDYGVAFANSQPFLARADIMSVCPGWEKSSGTAKEIITARRLGIPIYYESIGLALLEELISADSATFPIGTWVNDPNIGLAYRQTFCNLIAAKHRDKVQASTALERAKEREARRELADKVIDYGHGSTGQEPKICYGEHTRNPVPKAESLCNFCGRDENNCQMTPSGRTMSCIKFWQGRQDGT